ncbi:hypothetical protein [Ignatzschineria sp. LJL83]
MEIVIVIVGLLLLFSSIRFIFRGVGKIFLFFIGLVMKLIVIVIFIIVAVLAFDYFKVGSIDGIKLPAIFNSIKAPKDTDTE